MASLIEIDDLRVAYPSARGAVRAVDGVTLRIETGETYALVGESGCGKTATALAILRLCEPAQITGGTIVFEGRDLLSLPERELRAVRGGRIGMVFQEPAAALNPVLKIGAQVVEALRLHRKMTRAQAWTEAEQLLEMVALPDPARQARAYPHELSGGMKQRAMLAIALACSPALLIADEPTTALDVTIQAQILALLRRLKQDLALTVLLITHDFGIVAENADRVGVMYAGRIVEEAPVAALFRDPLHPYSAALLRASPAAPGAAPEPGTHGSRPRLPTIPGALPDPVDLPPGCRFHPRCAQAFEPCPRIDPPDFQVAPDRRVACLLYDPSLVPSGAARAKGA